MRVVVDAMGGDFAPYETVKGAVQAVKEYSHDVILTGDEKAIQAELDKYSYDKSRITIVHSEDSITMEDSPSKVLRGKRNSSIHNGLKLVKKGEGDAFYSAGNTGAVMVVAKMILKSLPGIDRPAIGAVMPNINGFSVVIDVGANVDSKPLNYLHFAIMGSAYAQTILNINSPRVGLLSIGEEEIKGNEITKAVNGLLKEAPGINFIGNVEGKDLFKGTSDVIVCDGFAGNVALKVSESAAWYMSRLIKEEFKKSFLAKIGAIFLAPALKNVKKRADYTEYGSAPLLGVDGICCIGHGSSNANAVKHGIRVAGELAENNVNDLIESSVSSSMKALKVDKEDTFWNNIVEKFIKKSS